MFLIEPKGDAQQDHDRDHERSPAVTEEIGCRSECQQEHVQGIDRAGDDLDEDRLARFVSHLVGADQALPNSGLFCRQAIRRAAEPLQRLFQGNAPNLSESHAARRGPCCNGGCGTSNPGRQGRNKVHQVMPAHPAHSSTHRQLSALWKRTRRRAVPRARIGSRSFAVLNCIKKSSYHSSCIVRAKGRRAEASR